MQTHLGIFFYSQQRESEEKDQTDAATFVDNAMIEEVYFIAIHPFILLNFE